MPATAPTNPAERAGRGHRRVRRGAFTLIELLVVIGIITVLFGSVFAASRVLISRAKNRETQSLLVVVQQALEEFKREQTANPTISRSRDYQKRFDRYPPDELEFFTETTTYPGKRGSTSLAPGRAGVVPAGPYQAMNFYTQGSSSGSDAVEHRDLVAMIVAIETLGEASAAMLGQIAEGSRVPGPVDSSGNPALFLDRNRNGNWDAGEDEAIRYIVDGWGVPLSYLAQRDFDPNNPKATESSNHPGWNEASTEIIRLNGGRPLIFSYGANGKEQLTQGVMAGPPPGIASLVGDFEDGTHSINHALNADNVYLDETLTGKLSQGID